METLSRHLGVLARRATPRILSQACRDPNSAAYGCFDRDWWHYKIRDFPSIILQQGGYTAWLAARLPDFQGQRSFLDQLAAAACRFWNRRAARAGAFEEYYPWEAGYPPLAFSTLAVMKLAAAGVVAPAEIETGARVAAVQLRGRIETQAGNQQVAGLAAAAWLRRVFPALMDDAAFEKMRVETMNRQHREGWFFEYGGPDTGYLSVALDCLWDLYDATGDERFIDSAGRAFDWLADVVLMAGGSPGMHNARNTDYVLPYGIARFAREREFERPRALALLKLLYQGVDDPAHFFHAVDDRYLCHYTGHSLLRAVALIQEMAGADAFKDIRPDPGPLREEAAFEGCGIFLAARRNTRFILAAHKGGVFTLRNGRAYASDYGWRVRVGRRHWGSHWWDAARWKVTREENSWTISGRLAPVAELISTPGRHLLLRLLSRWWGPRIIRRLKNRMIFTRGRDRFEFQRVIELEGAVVRVVDRMAGVPDAAEITPAPRASARHVASADSYHAEDARLMAGFVMERQTRRGGGVFHAETVYQTE